MANNKTVAKRMACQHCGILFDDFSSGLPRRYCSQQCKQQARNRRDALSDEHRARVRAWYHERGGKQQLAERRKRPDVAEYRRVQVRLYKARHPDKVAEWDTSYRNKRSKRIADQADGTAGAAIAALLKLRNCQYCGRKFAAVDDKRIDHRQPIAAGGLHSAVNLEVCCDPCNSRKRDMPFLDWLEKLVEPWKTRATKRAEKANGGSLRQLSLFVPVAMTRKRTSETDQRMDAAARRNAREAWEYWLYQKAPDWWLDGYYDNHLKPWADHRLTKAQAFFVRYKKDPIFARKWNDRRNARRREQRAARCNIAMTTG